MSSHFGAVNNKLQGGVRTIVQEMSALIFLLEKLNCVALARAEKQYTSTTADFPERRWWSRPKFERDLRASFTVLLEKQEKRPNTVYERSNGCSIQFSVSGLTD